MRKLRVISGIFTSLILLGSVSVCIIPVFATDYTIPPKETEKMPKHAKPNMSYKLSMKNKYMKIKASAGIEIDLPDVKKSGEKTKFKTTDGAKMLTKSKGTMNKQVGVKTEQLPTGTK